MTESEYQGLRKSLDDLRRGFRGHTNAHKLVQQFIAHTDAAFAGGDRTHSEAANPGGEPEGEVVGEPEAEPE